MDLDREQLEQEALETAIQSALPKLVSCEACPKQVQTLVKVGKMMLCDECAARESNVKPSTQPPASYSTSTPFPTLNKAGLMMNAALPKPPAAGEIVNSDLDPESEEYRAIFNETVLAIVDIPKGDKLFVVRERIDNLDRFIRKARIQRQALTVAIDDLYAGATAEERAKLIEQDKLFKAKTGKGTPRAKKSSDGAPKLTKNEQSMPSHWDAKARKAGTVFLTMGMDLSSVEVKLVEMGLVKK